ncbi:tyrosinase family protein [Galbibacter sp. EGI 63066]|uniref:tyrosinase family protein n=1 Tax=Galbibacter sp. EGI 63066 TaxID=2993559 RepID=UPI0022489E16|nr:tyrosinase family protein [Galbibacter sp. EGI 63066]MCX2679175.1 tyrosinase family protein [Galbibacter sp. EGI 63066]
MKFTIEKLFLLVLFLMLFQLGKSQSIRKNYQEMTEYEKTELINAFYQLRQGADRITDMADYHLEYANFDSSFPDSLDIHFNLPDEQDKEIFLVWHRRFVFEIEQAMQQINPKLTIPYWDSSVDGAINSQLWDEDFMGSFDTNWGLGRTLGQFGTLPTEQEIADMMLMEDFFEFSDHFERQNPHAGAHRWVGGYMRTMASPRDPVFYLHHSFVDKIWHEWEETHHNSSYLRTDMIRYDGTYVFDGETLPSVNPNDIIDTRALGVFYAEDGLATLDNYTVNNTYHSEELFYYQYTIQAGNNFIAAQNTSSRMQSLSEVVLQPGFLAESGTNFVANIDTDAGGNLLAKTLKYPVREYNPFEEIDLDPVWDWSETAGVMDIENNIELAVYPNPFISSITIKLDKKRSGIVEFYALNGALVKREFFESTERITIDKLSHMTIGTYIMKIIDVSGEVLASKKIIKI